MHDQIQLDTIFDDHFVELRNKEKRQTKKITYGIKRNNMLP